MLWRLRNCSIAMQCSNRERGVGLTSNEVSDNSPLSEVVPMSTSVRQSFQSTEQSLRKPRSNGDRRASIGPDENAERMRGEVRPGKKPRVYLAAENRLLREALSRMLAKRGDMEVVGMETAEPSLTAGLLKEEADILLLTSRGNMIEDVLAIRKVRAAVPRVQVLLIGVTGTEAEFLQCVRAGVRGYLPREASAEDVVEGVRAVQAGKAVCPGTLCAALFQHFEREATSFPSAGVRQRLGLTRREQQLIPLIAEGLTNKEIANRFCLSEQTVKNHLYRMKHKVGAGDRLDIVQVCRIQGFMV
jgi:DNA-binding NarL/FixJ family response regulator